MHLRCDEDKPCARCKKKNIICEPLESGFDVITPPIPPNFGSGNQHSDVAAAEDLLRLSDNQMYQQSALPPQFNALHQRPAIRGHSPARPLDLGHSVRMAPPPESLPNVAFTNEGLADSGDPFAAMFPLNIELDGWNNKSFFDFTGMETNFELSDVDFSFLDSYNTHIPFDYQARTPDSDINLPPLNDPHRTTALGHEAFKQSWVWRFKPSNQNSGRVQQQDLNIPTSVGQRRVASLSARKLHEKFDSQTRDKVLALVVSSCSGEGWTHLPPWQRWIAAFPSLELLDGLLQYCLSSPQVQCDVLFHMPTMSVRHMRPELVLALVAVGAVLTPDSALNKLGMALQELIRQLLPRAVSKATTCHETC